MKIWQRSIRKEKDQLIWYFLHYFTCLWRRKCKSYYLQDRDRSQDRQLAYIAYFYWCTYDFGHAETDINTHFFSLWFQSVSCSLNLILFKNLLIVGKGGHTPTPFLDQPFLEIQDAPTFHRSIGKTKVLNNSCNQFVYHFYPQSILILEESLQEWWNANLI